MCLRVLYIDYLLAHFCRLDKTKFYFVGAGLFTGVTVALYPVSVVKTRLQVATKDTAERSAYSVIRGLLRADGVPGLYRGFGTVITGAIPARIVFLTALETTKVATFRMLEPFKLSETSKAALANGVAGLTSSFMAQSVFVPIDVVRQFDLCHLRMWLYTQTYLLRVCGTVWLVCCVMGNFILSLLEFFHAAVYLYLLILHMDIFCLCLDDLQKIF